MTTFTWARPDQLIVETPNVRCVGWLPAYAAGRIPALWRRVADLRGEPDEWLTAMRLYGPLDRFHEQYEADRLRDGWKETVRGLAGVADLWAEGRGGIFAVPPTQPVELSSAYRFLQEALRRAVFNDVQLVLRGLDLSPEAKTLSGFLWLTAAEALRDRHRLRRCERCSGWMRIQRTDARFCSAICRNAPKAEAAEEEQAVAG